MSRTPEPLPPREALDVLEQFLADGATDLQRVEAIRHPGVPDGVLAGFVRTLERELRVLALLWCDRAHLLASWARHGDEDDRVAVAGNRYADPGTLLLLATDPSEHVRHEVAFNPSADVEVLWLLDTDPTPLVQGALERLRRVAHEEDDAVDDERGAVESLDFLHEMVPAAQEEDLLDEVLETALAERYLGTPEGDAPGPADVAAHADVEAEAWQLSEAQVRGLLEHRLGATPLPADGPGSDTGEPA